MRSLSLRYTIHGRRVEEPIGISVLSEKAKRYASVLEKEQDRESWATAEQMRASKENELLNGIVKQVIPSRKAKRATALTLLSYYDKVVSRKGNASTIGQYKNTRKYIEAYLLHSGLDPMTFTLAEVSSTFCKDFGAYLQTLTSKQTKGKLSDATRRTAISTFKAVLNQAVDEELLKSNPAKGLMRPSVDNIRSYLTDIELAGLQALEPTEPRDKELLRAFLFSCYCGLRLGDVEQLQWGNVERIAVGNDVRVDLLLRVEKTGRVMRVPLNKTAIELLGVRPKGSDKTAKVFASLPSRPTINTRLGAMTKVAGIEKKVTYHSSRHTYATQLINRGIGIDRVQKLLGHSDISITAKYLHSEASDLREATNILDK